MTTGKIEISEAVGNSVKSFPAIVSTTFGASTLLVKMAVEDLLTRSIVPNAEGISQGEDLGDAPSQRPVNRQHAIGLAVYMLKGQLHALRSEYVKQGMPLPPDLVRILKELGEESYYGLAPIVANVRPVKTIKVQPVNGVDHLFIDDVEIFRIIDGQHRRDAREYGKKWLMALLETGRYPTGGKSGALLYMPADGHQEVTPEEKKIWGTVYRAWLRADIEISVHLDLDTVQERQFFYVLNNLGRKVEAGLAFDFDESNAVNQYIKNVLIGQLKLKAVPKDMAARDEGEYALKDLVAVNAILFLNKTNVRSAQPAVVSSRQAVATKFWETVTAIPHFGGKGAKAHTVAAQPVMLKALAKLTYDLAFQQKDAQALEKLLNNIPKLDLTHQNPMWRYYEMQPGLERDLKLPGLKNYLPPEGTGNRDIGGFDATTGVMNFGAKHNDIYPLLGDMIRWSLQMPPRPHKKITTVAELQEVWAEGEAAA